jgi:hypothetical protein
LRKNKRHPVENYADKRSDTMSYNEITLDELRALAARAGLALTDDELERLLPGVNRAKKQTAELRALIGLDTEPAETFRAIGVAPK